MALNLVAKYENSLCDDSDSSQMPCISQLFRSTNTESYGGDGGGVGTCACVKQGDGGGVGTCACVK